MKSVYSAVVILLISGVLFAFAARQEYSQTIVKEFPIHSDGTVKLDNLYGPVEVHTWGQNRVKINITITVRSTSEQKAQNVFEEVDIQFENSSDLVSAATSVEDERSWWNWDDEKKDFSIQYKVWLPKTVNLDIQNKYGDIILEEMAGKATINLKHGNLHIPKLSNDLYLNFSHGTGQFGQVKDIEGQLSYCNIQIAQARDLKLESSFSNLQIENGGELFVNSKYNNFQFKQLISFDYEGRYDVVDIEDVQDLHANAKYSDFRVGHVSNSAAFNLEFGLASIEHVSPNFTQLSLIGQHTDYKVALETGMGYSLQAAADYAGISYPKSMNVTYENASSTFHEVEGNRGNSKSVIKAQLNYGGLKVTD